MVNRLFDEFAALEQVEAIALGGSRAGENFDAKSDYDVYLYVTEMVPVETRKAILEKYCDIMELGNHFWELEDNCTLKDGIDIDILYRDLDEFAAGVEQVVEAYHAHNGYTTCMWHNLNTCKIIYDRNGRLAETKKRFDVPYPKQLKEHIIQKNLRLLTDSLPAYRYQIEKAARRADLVSINHRTAAFLESYFDILFAMNELTHPGEKRLIELCKKQCSVLPDKFEEYVKTLLNSMFIEPENLSVCMDAMIKELKKVL